MKKSQNLRGWGSRLLKYNPLFPNLTANPLDDVINCSLHANEFLKYAKDVFSTLSDQYRFEMKDPNLNFVSASRHNERKRRMISEYKHYAELCSYLMRHLKAISSVHASAEKNSFGKNFFQNLAYVANNELRMIPLTDKNLNRNIRELILRYFKSKEDPMSPSQFNEIFQALHEIDGSFRMPDVRQSLRGLQTKRVVKKVARGVYQMADSVFLAKLGNEA